MCCKCGKTPFKSCGNPENRAPYPFKPTKKRYSHQKQSKMAGLLLVSLSSQPAKGTLRQRPTNLRAARFPPVRWNLPRPYGMRCFEGCFGRRLDEVVVVLVRLSPSERWSRWKALPRLEACDPWIREKKWPWVAVWRSHFGVEHPFECGSTLNRRGKPLVLVHVCTYQGHPFWNSGFLSHCHLPPIWIHGF